MRKYISHAVFDNGISEKVIATNEHYKNLKQFRDAIMKDYKNNKLDYLSFEEVIIDRG